MKKYQIFLSENFRFLVIKFTVYFNRRVFVMVLFRDVGNFIYIFGTVSRHKIQWPKGLGLKLVVETIPYPQSLTHINKKNEMNTKRKLLA